MKRLIITIALLAIVLLSANAFAASKSTGFYFDSDQGAAFGSAILDLGSVNSWKVWYTGSATISPTTSSATLTGNYQGNIWNYQYSTDKTNWQSLGTLVGTFSGMPNNIGSSKTENTDPTVVTARWLKLSYDATLTSLEPSSASGSGSISAAAVPEPGSIIALGSLIAPLGIAFFRKRS